MKRLYDFFVGFFKERARRKRQERLLKTFEELDDMKQLIRVMSGESL